MKALFAGGSSCGDSGPFDFCLGYSFAHLFQQEDCLSSIRRPLGPNSPFIRIEASDLSAVTLENSARVSAAPVGKSSQGPVLPMLMITRSR